jgi:hypothetical protein
MAHRRKPRPCGDRIQGLFHASLEPRRNTHILHRTAAGTDEVMVMLRQVLRQLEVGEVLSRDHTTDDVRALQHRQVPVDGALRETALGAQDVGDRDRLVRPPQDLHQRPTVPRVPLRVALQPRRDLDVQIAFHARSLAGMGIDKNHPAAGRAAAVGGGSSVERAPRQSRSAM